MALSPVLNDAVGLLQAMDPLEATRIVSSDRDLAQFLSDNRLELTPQELLEIKTMFRG